MYGEGDDAVRALDGVTLDVRRGEMVALVGPSGCGKSTLLNLVGCVDLPTSGTVSIDGSVTNALSDDRLTRLRRDRVGTVFQFFNLLPALRAADNVALPLVLQRVARARDRSARERGARERRPHGQGARVSGAALGRPAAARRDRARDRAPPRSCSPTSRPATWTR